MPIDKNLIISRIFDGKCIPILGAGANVSSARHNYKGLPLAKEIARALAKNMRYKEDDLKDVDFDLDLAKIALQFQYSYDRKHLIDFIKENIPDQEREPSPLLKAIAKLPFRFIITTNYDRLMERALEEENKPYLLLVQPKDGFDQREKLRMEEELMTFKGVVIYKLHGTFSDDKHEKSQLVITEDDYISFMSIINQDGGVPKIILNSLVLNTLLFLGYSLKDWDFRMIYESLRERWNLKGYVILREDPSKFWEKYLMIKGFYVYYIHLYDFAKEILEEYNKRLKD